MGFNPRTSHHTIICSLPELYMLCLCIVCDLSYVSMVKKKNKKQNCNLFLYVLCCFEYFKWKRILNKNEFEFLHRHIAQVFFC